MLIFFKKFYQKVKDPLILTIVLFSLGGSVVVCVNLLTLFF